MPIKLILIVIAAWPYESAVPNDSVVINIDINGIVAINNINDNYFGSDKNKVTIINKDNVILKSENLNKSFFLLKYAVFCVTQ